MNNFDLGKDAYGNPISIGDIVEMVINVGNFGVPRRPHLHIWHGEVVLIDEPTKKEVKVRFGEKLYPVSNILKVIGNVDSSPELLKATPRSYKSYLDVG